MLLNRRRTFSMLATSVLGLMVVSIAQAKVGETDDIVDTAVKGVIRIREVTPGGWFAKPTYGFELLVPEADWRKNGVSLSGERILRGIFGTENKQAAGPDGVVATVLSTTLDDDGTWRRVASTGSGSAGVGSRGR